jgi:hypothetical protein
VLVKPQHEGIEGSDLDVTAVLHLAQEGRIVQRTPANLATRQASGNCPAQSSRNSRKVSSVGNSKRFPTSFNLIADIEPGSVLVKYHL